MYVGMYSGYDVEVMNAIMNNITLIPLFIHNLDTAALSCHLGSTAV
jgi:hypothetical protein